MSKSEDIVHFGIGANEMIDKVVVEWPNGLKTGMDDLKGNKVHEIVVAPNETENQLDKPELETLFAEISESIQLNRIRHI